MIGEPRGDPIPAEARDILRRIADELRRTPRMALAGPAEVEQIVARTAERIEGMAATLVPCLGVAPCLRRRP